MREIKEIGFGFADDGRAGRSSRSSAQRVIASLTHHRAKWMFIDGVKIARQGPAGQRTHTTRGVIDGGIMRPTPFIISILHCGCCFVKCDNCTTDAQGPSHSKVFFRFNCSLWFTSHARAALFINGKIRTFQVSLGWGSCIVHNCYRFVTWTVPCALLMIYCGSISFHLTVSVSLAFVSRSRGHCRLARSKIIILIQKRRLRSFSL